MQQLSFILEADRLKHVQRRSYLADGSRVENAAEHSWHLALMALVLAEHAERGVSPLRVMQMVSSTILSRLTLATPTCTTTTANWTRRSGNRWRRARIFGLLPSRSGEELYELWQEFEARESADARFANALDRLMPCCTTITAAGGPGKSMGSAATRCGNGWP
jgi:putative hydrolases of HD superfamily